MVEAEFLNYTGSLVGYSVSGHADSGPFGHDIVCAAVSSAVMMATNTITDYLFCKADVKVTENKVMLVLKDPDSAMAISGKQMVASFYNHMKLMEKDSKGKIHISVKDVTARRPRQGA